MKTCSSCKKLKPKEDFSNSKSTSDGLDYYCRNCKREKYLRRREVALREAKNNYEKNREKILARKAEYYRENIDAKTEYNQEYYSLHRESIRSQQSEWSKANPDKARERNQRRRALIIGATVDMPADYWQILLDTFGPFCMNPSCSGQDPVLTHDHIVPLSKGGEHSLRNSQILCHSCNCRKGTKTIDYRVE